MNAKRHLSYAQGYLGLGLLTEAAAELDRIPAPLDESKEVLGVRMALLHEREDWLALGEVAEKCVELFPEDPEGWVSWAYATRRSQSLGDAQRILLEAEAHHPSEPTIQFNLGCYACLLGDFVDARRRVDRAIALDPKFKDAAATDPDLAALRALAGDARRRAN